jgi:opacity protein-like surface antigen
MKIKLLVFAAAAISAVAQPVSFGVKAGVPITDAFDTAQGNQAAYVSNTHRYLVGATVQFNLPLRFAVEVDGIYRRLGFDYNQFGGPGSPTFASTTANSWEFPVLGKWAILPGPVRPFVDFGANFRHISGVDQIRSTAAAVNVNVGSVAEFHKDTDIGATFGGGVEFKIGWLRLTPEFRYTRWGSENFNDPIGALLRTNKNQGDFMIGLTF